MTVEAPVMGTYKATIAAGCEVVLDISSQPCTLLDDSFKNCGDTGAVGTIDNNKLKALSVGDYFNAGDYEVKVTEVTGNEVNGWTGKGYTTLTIKGDAQTDVAVEFTGIQIDQCYQLKSGIANKVSVQYDPTWSNFIEPSKFIELLGDFLRDLKSWSQTYGSNPNSAESKEKAAELYELALAQQQSFEEDIALSNEERVEVLDNFKSVVDGLFEIKSGISSNQRIAIGCGNDPKCISERAEKSYTLYFSFLNKVFQFSVEPFCERQPDGSNRCGIVPKSWWEDEKYGNGAFLAGIVDGAYLTIKDVVGTVFSISDIIKCLAYIQITSDPECVETLDKALGMVQMVASIVKNPSILSKLFKQQYDQFIENTSGFSNINKYYHGRALFDVTIMAIGLGEASAILKSINAIKLAAMLKRADDLSKKVNVLNRMLNKVGLTTRKIGANSIEIIKRAANGSVTKVFAKYSDDIFKNLKPKTSEVKKKLVLIMTLTMSLLMQMAQ